MLVVADLEDQLDVLRKRRRHQLRDLGIGAIAALGGKRGIGIGAERIGVDRDPVPLQGLDQQGPGEGRRIRHLVDPHQRPLVGGDIAGDRNHSGPGRGGLDGHRLACSDGGDIRLDREGGGQRPRHDGGLRPHSPRGDSEVDEVVVDPHRGDDVAILFDRREQPRVDDDVAGDSADARRSDLFGQFVEAGERVFGCERGERQCLPVNMIDRREIDRSLRSGAAAHSRIGARDHDQVAGERPRAIDRTRPVNRRGEAIVGAISVERGRAGPQLGGRGAEEARVAVPVVQHFARVSVGDMKAPARVLVLGFVDDFARLGRNGWDRSGGQHRGIGEGDEQGSAHHRHQP